MGLRFLDGQGPKWYCGQGPSRKMVSWWELTIKKNHLKWPNTRRTKKQLSAAPNQNFARKSKSVAQPIKLHESCKNTAATRINCLSSLTNCSNCSKHRHQIVGSLNSVLSWIARSSSPSNCIETPLPNFGSSNTAAARIAAHKLPNSNCSKVAERCRNQSYCVEYHSFLPFSPRYSSSIISIMFHIVIFYS